MIYKTLVTAVLLIVMGFIFFGLRAYFRYEHSTFACGMEQIETVQAVCSSKAEGRFISYSSCKASMADQGGAKIVSNQLSYEVSSDIGVSFSSIRRIKDEVATGFFGLLVSPSLDAVEVTGRCLDFNPFRKCTVNVSMNGVAVDVGCSTRG